WLFRSHHAEDVCELALSDYHGSVRRDYSVDRSFVDAEGRRWIIDYKTSTPAQGQSLSDFLNQEVERYRPQLDNYARLLHRPAAPPPARLLCFTAPPCSHRLA